MPPSQSHNKAETVFGPDDRLNFHEATEASVVSYAELLEAREAAGLAFEATADRRGRVGGVTVGSLLDRQAVPNDSAEELSPTDEARLETSNIIAFRRATMAGNLATVSIERRSMPPQAVDPAATEDTFSVPQDQNRAA